jgi:hypothetical protein
MPTTKRDEERRKKREQRMAEDDEAKNYKFGGEAGQSGDGDKEDKEETKDEPNFGLSGKLTAETNTYKGVVIKYSEPAEARQPTTRWRLYQFKGEDVLPTLYVHRQSAYLIGRDRRVCGYCTGGILTCLYACGHCTGGGCPSRPPFVLQPACCAAVQTGQFREERRFHWEACQALFD